MGRYVISGGKKLKGTLRVNGSKNAALPILAATVLNGSINVLENCPKISDTKTALDILKHIGCEIENEDKVLIINSSNIAKTEIPEELVKKMRSSIIFMGPMLARFKKVTLYYPGGCELGKRPIDLHISAFRKMGAKIEEENGKIECFCEKLRGCEIELDFPSVGATQNIILAAVLAEGTTVIKNSAKEPEIADLCWFLVKCGAEIEGIGTSEIKIIGAKNLKSVTHKIIPDRIEAGTYLIMTAATGGKITLENVNAIHISPLLDILSKMGCKIKKYTSSITLKSNGHLINIPFVQTLPYPGIPTDIQPQLTALSSVARGLCRFEETIFENRTAHIPELIKMGADIELNGNCEFTVKGVKRLRGAEVLAKDLRGGAALITAGLCADGITVVDNSLHVERGYENIVEKLSEIGADITLKI